MSVSPFSLHRLFFLLTCFLIPVFSLASESLVVHKSPTCGCCELWLEQLSQQGHDYTLSHPADLNALKARYRIAPRYQSCHTAVSEQGFVFEGHIPGFLISRFLAKPPEGAIGLAVPGMPLGSPGMEAGNRFDPYEVLLLKSDGTSEVYATIASPEDQLGLDTADVAR